MPLGTDSAPPILIELNEWERVGAEKDPRLKGISFRNDPASQRLIEKLAGRVGIREDYTGLQITSTSYVGRVDIGPLRIAVYPKMAAIPLTRLFRYAYGLRDLETIRQTVTPVTKNGLQDLIVTMLCAEISELLQRGLSRRYMPIEENLSSPRGQIVIGRLVGRGGMTEARLPCRFFARDSNWLLNRVLLGGLHLAVRITEDTQLKRRVHQLSGMFGNVEGIRSLGLEDIDRAERALTRLTEANRSALIIVRLLRDSMGASLDIGQASTRTSGFLFDMNLFFQNLMSHFLREHLLAGSIGDQKVIRHLYFYAPDDNPKQRRPPAPRPDFALFVGNQLRAFLDAKYRDVWDRDFSADWLYQLSIYALASPTRVSVLLYASMADNPREERIQIRQPVTWSAGVNSSVIMRPVVLTRLEELLGQGREKKAVEERRRLAEQLVAL